MAPSPLPSNLFSASSSYSSQSFYLITFHSQPHCSNRFRGQKLKISCTKSVQHETNPVKKKRKPRPSFIEKIQDKWSLKIPSLREKFPWEEHKQESDDSIQDYEEHLLPLSEGVVTVTVSEDNTSGDSSASSSSRNKSILAPWVHGNKPRKDLPDSQATEKIQEESNHRGQNLDGFSEHCKNDEAFGSVVEDSGDLIKGVKLDCNCDETSGKVDTIPIGLSEKYEILIEDESEDAFFVEDSRSISQEFSSKKGSDDVSDSMRLPWQRGTNEDPVKEEKLRKSNTELAEKLIPEPELKRLRNVALRMVERMKVGAAGITQALTDAIHAKWKDEEIVKLKFEGPPSKNMKRTHEILEARTGGLVIWRSGSSVVLYRGMSYQLDCVQAYSKRIQADIEARSSSDSVNDVTQCGNVKLLSGAAESSQNYTSKYLNGLSEEELMDLSELNLLLDELGPRFMDWSGPEPLPVDADLLPAVVPGYRPPFRLLPNGVRQALRNKEMTYFRRTARKMLPHFALGRNRELQGLAMAMVKLWKKSAIAKIAIKRGVQNTLNERMAEELKILTGGTLLSRNKDYIVFYRGNDFLPPGISYALVEVEKRVAVQQDDEERARQKAATSIISYSEAAKQPLVAGTLAETTAATSRWGKEPSSAEIEKMMRDSAIARRASLVKFLERKLALASGKIRKAEKALMKLQGSLEPSELPTDLETLSDEERFLFRKIGLSMKPYLLLGRREVFDGTIENMHLHWKYRELVKILVDRKTFSQVKHIAVSLEAESGGVLVSVDKTAKGYAVIVYRGKNYQRPSAFRPKNLLTKRQALARSIELQRREGLKHHISDLQEKMEKLKLELENMKTVSEIDEVTLYSRINNASDEDMEGDEDQRAYLHTNYSSKDSSA
ncbi:CRM-domain containing factor CFM3, chloroplastic/mitochondrial-like [Olea europaea var. sylvestris]|uniref:CRM-domain containing factor CFM3, chloroplastic/mitochondrial-like n=1 Tax=Olea europaea var. sylvestris TaxID=158386 RepID=UPI000C1CEDC1|nr:CRM-domain containing factor CFM3, chloroplastic/mitochondrial-like [Olea europaea var. sylvestris]